MKKLDEMKMGYAAGATSAVVMLALGILGNLGLYSGAVSMMEGWHMFFTLSPLGILGGMIEAAIISFPLGYLFGWFYNKQGN